MLWGQLGRKGRKAPVADHKDHKDHREILVRRGHRVREDHKDHKDPLVLRAHKAHKVLLEPLAHLVQLEDRRVLVAHKVQLVPLGCLAQLVLKDWADHKVHKDHRAPKAILTPLPVQHH